ncbi:Immunoglobulin superfamily DCC subclass member 3 [Porites harrisoni]
MMYLSFFLLFFVPFFVYGATNSSVSSVNKDPCHYCNVRLTCQCTDLGNAVKSLESKVESLIRQNNKSFGIGDAVKSLEAKLESRTGLNNKTSCVGEAVKTLEAKVEGLLELKNKTSGIADALMSLDAKVEGFTALNNKTFGVADVLKSLEVKMENLNGLNKTSGISKTVKTLEEKIESLSELRNKTSRIGDAVKSLEAKVENLIALINRTSFIPQPVPIPTECQNYQSLTAADRKITYTTYHGYCDNSITEGWYRFEGAAGTRMPTSCMPSGNRTPKPTASAALVSSRKEQHEKDK